MKKIALIIASLVLSSASWAQDKITVYAASSMTNAVDELAAAYELNHDVDVTSVYAGSSSLARQIENGAPADVFISANEKWVRYLVDKNMIAASHVSLLAGNDLVIVTPKSKPVQAFDLTSKEVWMQALGDSRLAVGNTDAVPVGMYSKEALTHLNLWDELLPHLAQTNNVRLALALVERGESPLGIVYRTDALLSDKVQIVQAFEPALHSPIHYPVAQLSDSEAVADFVHYLSGPKAGAILKKYGFRVDMGNEKFAD